MTLKDSFHPVSTRLETDMYEWVKKRAINNRRSFTGELNVILRPVYEAQKEEK